MDRRIHYLDPESGFTDRVGTWWIVSCLYANGYKTAGSKSATKEGDLEPMYYPWIDFHVDAKSMVPGPTSLTERPAK